MSTTLRAALLSLILAVGAAAADLKPGESLPWCRVTVNHAATIDTDEPVLRTFDGWWDSQTCLLIPATAWADEQRPTDPPAPMDPARVVKVQTGTHSPKPFPAKAREHANAIRRKHGRRDDAKPQGAASR